MRNSNLTLIFLLMTACNDKSDNNINVLTPDLFVEDVVDFGDVVVLYSGETTLSIANAGRAPLIIDSLSIDGNDDGAFSIIEETGDTASFDPAGGFEIDADESYDLVLNFKPETYISYARDLVIQSNNAADDGETRVTLLGEGVDGPVPDILVTPQSLDFGTVALGAVPSTYFTIQNIGDGDLNIGTTTQTGGGAFVVDIDPENTLLPAGQMTIVPVRYIPTSESGDNGSFIIESNDPDDPSVEMFFLGNGGGDFDYPVAMIDCPSSSDPPETLSLDGSGSNDPQGYVPLAYTWTILEQPDGSNGTIADDNAETTTMFVDAAGTWRVSLSVENTAGIVSAPAECEFEAIPDDSLYVELVWDAGNADVDLHLIEDGAGFGELPGDCCWCNPNPSWGGSGDEDNPDLSLDNTVGFGPESITLPSPADGDFTVWAHYFSDSGGGTTTATIRIYIDGVKEWEGSEILTHNDAWSVAYVRWPEGYVVEQNESTESALTRSCD
ncbi:MAG: hypothetical protein ACI8RZ_003539 [Myxococcota bacterium]|jgi:hypothetical protein